MHRPVHRRPARRFLTLTAAAALAVSAAACGGDDDAEPAATQPAATQAPATQPAATAAPTATEPPATEPPATAPAGTPAETTTPEAPATDPLAPQPLAERASLRVGIAAKVEVFAPLLLADALGELEKENIEVEIFNTLPSDVLVLLSQGQADVSVFAVDAGIFNAVKGGVDIKWVSEILDVPADTNEGFLVATELLGDDDPANFDFSKLKGATIAVPRAGLASGQTYDLITALAKGGLTIDDVTLLPLSNPDHVTAIANGAVQAINAEVDPFASSIIEAGDAVLVQPLLDDIATGGYFMRSNLVDDQPEVAEAFMRALIRTSETYLQPGYHEDPEVVAAIAEAVGAPPENIAASPEKLFHWPVPEHSFATLQDMFMELGMLEYDEPIDPSTVINTTIVAGLIGE